MQREMNEIIDKEVNEKLEIKKAQKKLINLKKKKKVFAESIVDQYEQSKSILDTILKSDSDIYSPTKLKIKPRGKIKGLRGTFNAMP